jgi:hypothetical protein
MPTTLVRKLETRRHVLRQPTLLKVGSMAFVSPLPGILIRIGDFDVAAPVENTKVGAPGSGGLNSKPSKLAGRSCAYEATLNSANTSTAARIMI